MFLKFRLLIIFFSAVLTSSCVYDKEFAYLKDQNSALNKRIIKLEESIDEKLGTDLDLSFQSIRFRQAEFLAEMEQLKGEMSKLSGRVEDNELIIKRTVERDLSEQDNIKAELARLTEKMNDLESLVKRQYEHLELESLETQESQEREAEGIELKDTVEEPEAVEKVPKLNESELYEISMSFYEGGKFIEAIDGFEDFLKEFPKSDRADDAQFWIGECCMALKQYKLAVLAYDKVLKKFPEGNNAPNAMLHQAIAALEIKDKTFAEIMLRRVIKTYPNSSEAEIAKAKLQTIK